MQDMHSRPKASCVAGEGGGPSEGRGTVGLSTALADESSAGLVWTHIVHRSRLTAPLTTLWGLSDTVENRRC